jgi:hypothetical protein
MYRVGDGDPGEIFRALAAELAGYAYTKRSAVTRREELLAIHPIGQQGLRMPGVGHIDAVPLAFNRLLVCCLKIAIGAKKHNVLSLRQDSDQVQNLGKRDANPFGYEGPALFAGLMENMPLGRKPLQFRKREEPRAGDQAVDFESPVQEPASQ